eukprot:GHVL01003999.1.p1 GENE.GHVL01003999.1~~GHVL01003999.1.p1  ORF type:complete len:217 (+),score=50.55 GHVL01003999.1:33-683(+)
MDEKSLSDKFQICYKNYIDDKNYKNSEKLYFDFLKIGGEVEKLGLFSSNEEIDDISTANLKFILVPYILAHLSSFSNENRLEKVEKALVNYRIFVDFCVSCELAHSNDKTAFVSASMDPATRRNDKIERFRRQKEMKEKLKILMERREKYGLDSTSWNSSFDEETERLWSLSVIKDCVSQAIEEIFILEKEIPLLEERRELYIYIYIQIELYIYTL